jgi:hypothetical protein
VSAISGPDADFSELLAFVAAHRQPAARPDAARAPRERSLARHRARRPRWKPPLEAVHPQHAYDRDALAG